MSRYPWLNVWPLYRPEKTSKFVKRWANEDDVGYDREEPRYMISELCAVIRPKPGVRAFIMRRLGRLSGWDIQIVPFPPQPVNCRCVINPHVETGDA